MSDPESPPGPDLGRVVTPASTPSPPIDLEARASTKARSSPTDRLEARADRHIQELQADKSSLRDELESLRRTDIPHLRDDVR